MPGLNQSGGSFFVLFLTDESFRIQMMDQQEIKDMNTVTPKILIINGSIRGKQGNSWSLCKTAEMFLTEKLSVVSAVINLSEPKHSIQEVYNQLLESDGFLIVTGAYWNNWGSPLQRFIEIITTFENSPALFGKPVACAVSVDSVGGADVAARLHAVFSGLGCWSPPCATLVVSRVGQEAVAASKGTENDPNDDVWRVDDMEIVLQNLVTASGMKGIPWKSWPFSKLNFKKDQWPETGDLDLGSQVFL